jgi:hypothetical protein
VNRRELLKLMVLAGAGTVLPFCRARPQTPQREVPPAFRSLVGELDAKPELDLFIGAKEFVAGTGNRVPFVLVFGDGRAVEGDQVSLYVARSERGELPVTARFQRFNSGSLHSHDTERNQDSSPFESAGFYEADISPKSAGFLHLMAVTEKSPRQAGFAAIETIASSKIPGKGVTAIPIDTPTSTDQRGSAYLCTNEPPCPMHDASLRDVLTAGRPAVFTVATPRFCRSRLCGPVVEEVLLARTKWAERVDFVHAEVYTDNEAKTPSSSMTTWNLDSEPWVFLIDSAGSVRDRFEGPVVSSQVEAALEAML